MQDVATQGPRVHNALSCPQHSCDLAWLNDHSAIASVGKGDFNVVTLGKDYSVMELAGSEPVYRAYVPLE